MRVLALIEGRGVTGPARNLLESGAEFDLHVATYRRRGASADQHAGIDEFVTAFASRGVPVTVIDERYRFDPGVRAAVRALTERVGPDIVETHNIKSHALLASVRGALRVPWVAFHHGYTQPDLKMRVYNRLDRHALRHADTVIVPCQAFIGELAAAGVDPSRISVLHNAVASPPLTNRTRARRSIGLRDERVILSVGRLSREKGHDVLIDACASLDRDLWTKPCVLIVGDGPERRRLEQRAAAARVPVRFDGFQSSVAAYYAAADLFVLPSRSEGSPNALLEALAAGCAAIATRVGGVPEIVAHDISAKLVPPDRPDQLRDAIADLLADPIAVVELAAGARRAASRMTPAARLARLRTIYSRVLSTQAPAGATR